jgi:signal-transduction protein with cAMP-binding, CBS, and nucleotidyltransferase domain
MLIRQKKCPDNYINPKKLTHMEQVILKEAFSQVSAVSNKIKFLIQFYLID